MQPTSSSSSALTLTSRYTDEGVQSSTMLHCSCGAVFQRKRSRPLTSRYTSSKECVDSDGHLIGAIGLSTGSMLAVCPSCGAQHCFESTGYHYDY
jgi:hypothetical protein